MRVAPDTSNPLPALPAARHRPGRGSEIRAAERREIMLTALAEGLPIGALADRFGRTRRSIARVLKHPDFDTLRERMDEEGRQDALRVLQAHRTVAAQAWTQALGRAAQKGDHRPSRDLLLHTDVISPISQQGSGPAVIVNIGQIIGVEASARGLPIREPIIEAEALDGKAALDD